MLKTYLVKDLSTNIMTDALGETLGWTAVGGETQTQGGAGRCSWETTAVETSALQSEGERSGQNEKKLTEDHTSQVHCTRCQGA